MKKMTLAIKKTTQTIKRKSRYLIGIIATFLTVTLPCEIALASGGDIGSSDFAKGFQKLLEDLTKWLIIIAPIVTGCLLIYLFIRRGSADEHEQKSWNKRIVSALVCGILAVGASLVIKMFSGYFGS